MSIEASARQKAQSQYLLEWEGAEFPFRSLELAVAAALSYGPDAEIVHVDTGIRFDHHGRRRKGVC